jgi:hypothetical protein
MIIPLMQKLKAYLYFALAFVFFALSFAIFLIPTEDTSKMIQRDSHYAVAFRNLLIAKMGTGAMRNLNI